MKLCLYVVAACPDPDHVTCSVPYRVDDEEIFFGPCKKRLREELHRDYLDPETNVADPPEDLYVVGVNGNNATRLRKIIWAGRVKRIMTFCRAYHELSGARYTKMREWKKCPLHVRPLYEGSRLVGYEHTSQLHEEADKWVLDLIKSRTSPDVHHKGKRLMLRAEASPWRGFSRDACFLLENMFFAQGQGLSLDEEALNILRRAQPKRRIEDNYAIFGYQRNGAAEGLIGRYLQLRDSLADELMVWIRRRAPSRGTRAARTERRCH